MPSDGPEPFQCPQEESRCAHLTLNLFHSDTKGTRARHEAPTNPILAAFQVNQSSEGGSIHHNRGAHIAGIWELWEVVAVGNGGILLMLHHDVMPSSCNAPVTAVWGLRIPNRGDSRQAVGPYRNHKPVLWGEVMG